MEHVADPASEPRKLPDTAAAAPNADRPRRSWAVRRVFQAQSKAGRRLSIRFKVFALLLAQSLLVVVAFAALVAWAFNRGFAQYMTSFDDARGRDFATVLEAEYAKDGNWDVLRANPQHWAELAFAAAGNKVTDTGKLQQLFQSFRASDFPAGLLAPLPLRFALLSTDHQLLIGSIPPGSMLRELEIVNRGRVVGFLGFPVAREHPYDIQFRDRFRMVLGVIIVVSVFIAMVPAFLIARSVMGSVSSIGRAARTLAAGTRVAPLPVESNDELGDLAHDFNELSIALERNKNLQRQWLAEISHELRTPVQILMAETEAVVDGMRTPSREGFKSLYDESHRLSRLIEDLHNLSLMDAGIARLRPVVVSIAGLLRDCVSAEQTRFTQRNIRVTIAGDAGDPQRVIGDADKLRQVVMNLLENSLRYTDEGGEVQIAVAAAGDWVQVRYEDSSPGAAEHEISHLFERLYRGEASRNRASGGAGLGLAIVQSIVEAHGGHISASQSPLGGLRFDIRLPRAG